MIAVGDEVIRTMPTTLRAVGEGAKRIVGLAAPYGEPTTLYEGSFIEREVYDKGCFANSIASSDDIISCFNHDLNIPLGRRRNKTLTVSETEAGAEFDVTIDPEDPEAMRIYQLTQRGTVYGSSVRFRVLEGHELMSKEDGKTVYTFHIEEASMRELGPVIEPAYDKATAESRMKRREEVQRNRKQLAEESYQDFLRAIRAS